MNISHKMLGCALLAISMFSYCTAGKKGNKPGHTRGSKQTVRQAKNNYLNEITFNVAERIISQLKIKLDNENENFPGLSESAKRNLYSNARKAIRTLSRQNGLNKTKLNKYIQLTVASYTH